MHLRTARQCLQSWISLDQEKLEQALAVLIVSKGGDQWLRSQQGIFTHPRDTIDPKTLGIHQDWQCNLELFREAIYDGKTLYLFEQHIESLRS